MAPAGPLLPTALSEKRKRADGKDSDDSESGSDSDIGPAPPSLGQSEGAASKKPRVIGPSLPPQSVDEPRRIQSSTYKPKDSDSGDDDDDDDFGPSLPPTDSTITPDPTSSRATDSQSHSPSTSTAGVKRDEWMTIAPTGGDWTARVDPTKLKNRKFNTGKNAKTPSAGGGAANAWHETPQERQARLQREMMGIKDTSTKANAASRPSEDKADAETASRLREYNKSRGPTLYDSHQKGQKVEQDDDPSARAFDREKDIGGGLQINATQRRDMMKKASDFGSRFSGAKYL